MPGSNVIRGSGARHRKAIPSLMVARPSANTEFSVTRLKHVAQKTGIVVGSPRLDGFCLTVSLAGLPAFDLSVDGRSLRAQSARIGDFHLHALDVEVVAEFKHSFDVAYFYIPRAVLDGISAEWGISRIETLRVAAGAAIKDATVANIVRSLLPSLERPGQASPLFMDHVGTALLAHLTRTYGDSSSRPRQVPSGLEPWQQRRAEDMIVAHLDGDILLDELACECGLSRLHFAQAFRKTMRRQPYQLLLERRIERSKDLLINSKLPLAEIAALCGFVDSDHFGRVFTGAVGIAPSKWRRLQRS